jgi:hypothetical protein
MANKKQFSKPGMETNPLPHGVKTGGTVGCDVPDESKERHTEIAVEAGRKRGEQHDGEHNKEKP